MISAYDVRRSVPIPPHWVGVYKDWLDVCESLGEALVCLPPSTLATHCLAIGSTGSGKTNFLHHLIAGDILRGQSIVVLDARGDLALATIELAARAGVDARMVKFFNLREKERPLGFDPLAGAGEPYYRALGLLDAVAAESESWGVQLAETFRNALLLLAETGHPITRLEAFLHEPVVRKRILATTTSKALQSFWTRYDSLTPDKQNALASPVLNKVSALLATEGLRRVLGHPEPIDLGAHLSLPGSITLISLAVDELHSAGWMMGSIMLSAICRDVFSRANTPESQRPALRLYVDEFENFAMRDFETILAEGRRFKFSVVLSHQTLAQLTPKMRSLILGNVGVKLAFRLGYQDAAIFNRDLTGTKGSFDFPSLPVGEAILWRRGIGAYPVEINAPLIRDVGRLSTAARALQRELAARVPPYVQPNLMPVTESAAHVNLEEQPPASPQRVRSPKVAKPSLEDWLQ